jgi:hypothetical protein
MTQREKDRRQRQIAEKKAASIAEGNPKREGNPQKRFLRETSDASPVR